MVPFLCINTLKKVKCMAYQINPIEFKKIVNDIIDENINVYSNKREADTLLLNSDERNEDNDDILARIEDYTTKIDRLQNFMKKCEPFYGQSFNAKDTSSAFLKEFCRKCAQEYDTNIIQIDNFFGDLMWLAIERYLQLRARNTSTITPQVKVVTVLVSRATKFSFTGTQSPEKYNIISQSPQIASIKRDENNPWLIHVDGVASGATNIIIEDTENEVSVQVPTVIRPSTLYCPVEVVLTEGTSKSFKVSSNIDPIDVEGLQFDGEKYVEQSYEEDGVVHHPFDEFILSREGDTVTVEGVKPTVNPTTLACSIYDQTKRIDVKVLPCVLQLSAYNVQVRQGKRQNINLTINVDISKLKYEFKPIVGEDIADLEITHINGDSYNVEIMGKVSGHSIVTFKCASTEVDLDLYITERT